eukprot:TRINITY_DN10723_c0_g1_i5.p1 TRINITY_DN10723_c0_g1~~TRINITY_DN10723_c0_g1_i5.p1  ORF type:complete len:983 (+),score=193.35 TRINITY_DN10723_c0_g1_i5:474-3422(+)
MASSTPSDKLLSANKEIHLPRTHPSPSDRAIDIDSHKGNDSSRRDAGRLPQEILTKIVREKDMVYLQEQRGVEGIGLALETDLQKGINGNAEDLSSRRYEFGRNTYRRPPVRSLFHFILEAFKDVTILILLVCAALSLALGIKENGLKDGWCDGGSILIAIFLVIAVSAVTNFQQEQEFHKLSSKRDDIKVEIIRTGRRQDISIFDIVVGDVVCLKTGDQIPADGLFLNGHSLQVDESSMTGESDYISITSKDNPFLVSGTKVVDGNGHMLVTAVGMNTWWGMMMSSINRNSDEKTPLQARLYKLTSCIGKIGLAVALLVLVVLVVRYFTGNMEDDNGNRGFNGKNKKIGEVMNSLASIFAAAVTIVVVAIPEGLPLAVTLTLAYSMKKMMVDQALVRRLSACETMGSATTICTDKTGTLTVNQMEVTEFWLGGEAVNEDTSAISPNILELLHQGVGLNTSGCAFRPNSTSMPEISGSPTEKAILSWAVHKLGIDMEKLMKSCNIQQVENFNSEKKRSGILMNRIGDKSIHVHWKGAAEMILAMCSGHFGMDGAPKDIDEVTMMKYKKIIKGMADQSLRCIAFAYKEIVREIEIEDCDHDYGKTQLAQDGLTLLGLVGLKDPCRSGVREAVDACQNAGVSIKMITGDNIFTARAIAVECGILKPDQDLSGVVVEGEEFRNYSDKERLEKVDRIRVMARSSPSDKLLMVQCLRKKGEVVAVTGDGTNDAPALKEADIGLSMGLQGTEVAKESSDIIILDDNFSSVVTVLRWGRCVNNNIQKFIQFQLTVNVAVLVINFVAVISSGKVPLTTVQLLWANLIMDTLGALALTTEHPTDDLMEKKPVGQTGPLITNAMWRNIIAQALYQIVALLTLQFKGGSIFGVDGKVQKTLIFNTFVLCQVFNEFNARKLEGKNVFEGIHKNKLFVGIISLTIFVQVVMVELLPKFASTERLDWTQWCVCIAIAAVSWPIGWVVKCIPIPCHR